MPDPSKIHGEAYPGSNFPKEHSKKSALAFFLVVLLPAAFGIWAGRTEAVPWVERLAYANDHGVGLGVKILMAQPPVVRALAVILLNGLPLLLLHTGWIRLISKWTRFRDTEHVNADAWHWHDQMYTVLVLLFSLILSRLVFSVISGSAVLSALATPFVVYASMIATWKPYAHTIYKTLTPRSISDV